MKKAMLMGLVGISSVLMAATAYADSWTIWGRVVELSNADVDAYRVISGASLIQNPANCTAGTDYYEKLNGNSAAEIDLMNRTLLSAFLAGRKVKLFISSSACGPTGRPAYVGVRVHETQ